MWDKEKIKFASFCIIWLLLGTVLYLVAEMNDGLSMTLSLFISGVLIYGGDLYTYIKKRNNPDYGRDPGLNRKRGELGPDPFA